MRFSKNFLAALVAAVLLSPAAQAGILIEPYVGYYSGNATFKDPTTSLSESAKGLGFGGRLGWQIPGGFMAGADVMMTKWQAEFDPETDFETTDLGAFVGFNFPMLLRVYGAYIFSSTGKVKNTGEADIKGTAMKVGIGYTALPMLAINLEYIAHKTEFKESADIKVDTSMIGLTVSLPISP